MSGAQVKVGDRVSFLVGTRTVVARVVRDLGEIGVGGRQLVVVEVSGDEAAGVEAREFDMPAEELEVIEPSAA